jgi:uncharacterized membrane protein HdeD (DUF308 family)
LRSKEFRSHISSCLVCERRPDSSGGVIPKPRVFTSGARDLPKACGLADKTIPPPTAPALQLIADLVYPDAGLYKEAFMAQNTSVEMVKHASTLSIMWGVLLIVFGVVAIGAPLLAAVAVNALVAWLIILAGIVHIMLAFRVHGAGSVIWKLLVGVAYLCFGGYLIVHPLLGIASLTLVLATLFLIEGILNIILFVKMRPIHGSTWMLIDGLVTLLLAGLIYMQWPSSSIWVIGTLVGISMMSLAVRKATGTISSSPSSLAA